MVENIFSKILLLSLFSLLLGCLPNQPSAINGPDTSFVTDEGNLEARLSFFLSLTDPDAPPVSFTLEDLEVLSGERWLSMLSKPRIIKSTEIKSGQIFISRKTVSAGNYNKIRVRISKAGINSDNGDASYRIDDAVIELSLRDDLFLTSGESRCIFLNWDVQKSIERIAFFSLHLTPYLQSTSLTTDLAYVSCPDIDTVYLFRTDTNRVIGAIGIAGRPIYLAASSDATELYILTAHEPGITVIEISTGKIKNRLSLPMIQEPSFFIVDTLINEAYILDRNNRYIFRVTLNFGNIAAQKHFDNKIEYITFLNNTNRLALSSPLDQKVILLDKSSLAILSSIGVGGGADGLFADEEKLYIAENRNNNIGVFDLKTSRLSRIQTSYMPKRIIKAGNLIYVSNFRGGTLSVFFPGSLNVLRNIKVGGNPSEISFSEKRRWLYVSNADRKGLNVVDLGNSRPSGFIELGTMPLGMVVVQ